MAPEQQTKEPHVRLTEDEHFLAFGRFFAIILFASVGKALLKAFLSFVSATYTRIFAVAVSASVLLMSCWNELNASSQSSTCTHDKSSPVQSTSSTAYRGQGIGSKYSTQQGNGTGIRSSSSGATGSGINSSRTSSSRDRGARPGHGGRANGHRIPPTNPYAYNPPELDPVQFRRHDMQQQMDEINRKYQQDMDDIQRKHRDAIYRQQLAFEELHHRRQQQQRQRRQEDEQRQWRHYQQPPRQERFNITSQARSMTHYDVLGIHSSASADEIKRAYKRKALRHHPDKGGSASSFRRVQGAYETLKDDQKRRAYDCDIRWGR